MSKKITIEVNLETIKSGNAELLMCEARDYIENGNNTTKDQD